MTATARRPSLTRRMILLSVAGVLLVTAASAWIGARLLEQELAGLRDRELGRLADHIVHDLREQDLAAIGAGEGVGPPQFAEIFSGAYWQARRLTGDGEPLRSRSLWDTALPAPAPPDDPPGFGFAEGPLDQRLRVWIGRVERPDGTLLVQVATDTADYDRIERLMTRLATGAMIAEGVLAVLAVSVLGFMSLRSMRRFAGEIKALRNGEREELSESVPAEIAPAAQEVNALKAAQNRLLARARDQAAALAHSLKTPLAVLIQAAESDDRVPSDVVRTQADQALRQVNLHLALARSAGGAHRNAATEVGPVLDGIARVLGPRLDEAGVALEISAPDAFRLPMEEADLYDVLGNLLDNAARHARRSILVSAFANGTGDVIQIDDDGPGLGPVQIRQALSRGRSLDDAPGLSGLGLTLAQDIVQSYGGVLEMTPSPLGGLRVTIRVGRPPTG